MAARPSETDGVVDAVVVVIGRALDSLNVSRMNGVSMIKISRMVSTLMALPKPSTSLPSRNAML